MAYVREFTENVMEFSGKCQGILSSLTCDNPAFNYIQSYSHHSCGAYWCLSAQFIYAL